MKESDFDHRALCPQCGMGVGFDEDGCCTGCGADVCAGDTLRAHLAAVGFTILRVCPAHDLRCHDARCEVREAAE